MALSMQLPAPTGASMCAGAVAGWLCEARIAMHISISD